MSDKLRGLSYYCRNVNPAAASQDPMGNKYNRRYEITVAFDNKDEEKNAKSLGLRIKPKNDKIPYPHTKVTSDCQPINGSDHLIEQRRPKTYLGKVAGYTGTVYNESRVTVLGSVGDSRGGKKFYWRALQITELADQPDDWEQGDDFNESDLDPVDDTDIDEEIANADNDLDDV
jgi:hypothetical protein